MTNSLSGSSMAMKGSLKTYYVTVAVVVHSKAIVPISGIDIQTLIQSTPLLCMGQSGSVCASLSS